MGVARSMAYNFTVIANTSSLLGLTQNVNTYIMDGWFGVALLAGIACVLFINFGFLNRDDVSKNVVATSFITLMLCILFSLLGLVPNWALVVTILGFALSIWFTWR